jgi:hypothetical protein
MSELTTPAPAATTAPGPLRAVARWMVTFVGFPLGGLTTDLLVGPVNSPVRALLGGLLTGGILGLAQAWGLGRNRPSPARWVAATAVGLMVGLVAATSLLDFRTGLADLVVQGAICGAAVGILQALVLRPLLGSRVVAWPVALSAIWAGAWAITVAAGVQVDQQFSVFGASGAIVATALTAVLPIVVNRTVGSAS